MEALFIYMVESWVAERCVDRESSMYIKDPDMLVLVRSIGNKKEQQWVGMASIAIANSTFRLRVDFMKYFS